MRTVQRVRAAPDLLGQRISLAWQNPPTSDFPVARPMQGIRIVRRLRTFPLDEADGDVVYDGPVVDRFSDGQLDPLTTYYYTIFAVDSTPAYYADEGAQIAAFSSADFRLAERLYSLLPGVHQRSDVLSPAELAQMDVATVRALQALPPDLRGRGPLRRFFAATFTSVDLMRSLAEGLRQLHDVDQAPPAFLPLLASWLGWDLDRSRPLFEQRNEIKAAPHLYRAVGNVPNLASLVNRYTGWRTQVAEFMQNIARANLSPQLNIFSLTEAGGAWLATDDSAPALGFGSGNNRAPGSAGPPGSPGLPAILVGSAAEPFALRPGMELAVTADDHLPVVVRFGDADFAAVTAATAAEVAAVLNRTLSEVVAIARGDGRLELRSDSLGAGSSLSLAGEAHPAALVTLEGAWRGRLAAFRDRSNRLRLFYTAPDATTPGPTAYIRFKSFRDQAWGDSQPVPADPGAAQDEPAAVELNDGSLFLAWVENPNTPLARLRFRTGQPDRLRPARLIGRRNAPFDIAPGSTLLLRSYRPVPLPFVFRSSDFANPHAATGLEVVTALNARLPGIVASLSGGAVQLETAAPGGDEYLEIDLRFSSAAQSLGFDAANAAATGDWGDGVNWRLPEAIPTAPAGAPGAPVYHADLAALADATGVVWLFWAMQAGAGWQIASTRWNGTTWSPLETLAASPFGDREPGVALDAAGRIWLFWSRRKVEFGVPNRAPEDDNWTLWRRFFDGAWNAEAELLASPAGRAADRQPAPLRLASGDLQVFFQTDRAGNADVWSLTFTPPAGVPGAAAAVTAGPTADHWPAPLFAPDGSLWLLYRSDRSVSPSRVLTRPLPELDNRVTSPPRSPLLRSLAPFGSIRLSDVGTVRRFAGTSSVCLGDAARNSRSRQWDDLLAYTPQAVQAGAVLRDDDLYTRGTVGLYLTQVVHTTPLSLQRVERLLAVLNRFLPINVRVVVILAPRLDSEIVYGELPDGTLIDIGEQYDDRFPFLEAYPVVGELTTAIMPGVLVLHSVDFDPATPDDVSADPANLQSLRRRSYFPPLQ